MTFSFVEENINWLLLLLLASKITNRLKLLITQGTCLQNFWRKRKSTKKKSTHSLQRKERKSRQWQTIRQKSQNKLDIWRISFEKFFFTPKKTAPLKTNFNCGWVYKKKKNPFSFYLFFVFFCLNIFRVFCIEFLPLSSANFWSHPNIYLVLSLGLLCLYVHLFLLLCLFVHLFLLIIVYWRDED